MSEFIFLFRGKMPSKSPEEMQQYFQHWKDWIAQLTIDGTYKGGARFHPETKLVEGPDKIVTDGPFVEAKEVIGGYLIVEASDISNAVEIAMGCPVYAEDGHVEVRPAAPNPA